MSNISNKVRLIPSWAGSLISGLLAIYAPRLLDAIQSVAIKSALTSILGRAREAIKAVSDSNPQNVEQLEAILKDFIGQDIVPLADGVITEKIALIGNERVRRGLSILSVPVIDSLRLLTDENPNNAQQAEEVFDGFVLDPVTQEFIIIDLLTPVLEARIPDPLLRSFILEALSTGIREGAEALADQDLFNAPRVLEAIKVAEKRAKVQVLNIPSQAA